MADDARGGNRMSTPILRRLRRIRWAVRATLTFGVAASVAANVLHADTNPISQSIAAWPPLALLLTVELVSRVPVHRSLLLATRVLATVVIAGIAAWVSYWHMQGVASRYGETGASPYLLPVSVDGLIVVASICLVELAGRIRYHEEPPAAEPAAVVPVASPIPVVVEAVPAKKVVDVPVTVTVPSGRKPVDPSGPTGPAARPEPRTAPPAITNNGNGTRPAPWTAPPPPLRRSAN
jgi:hypothetical protein